MRIELLPLNEQVIVITGASSGIGLVTAKQAAQRGAAVVLASRNGNELAQASPRFVTTAVVPSTSLLMSLTPSRSRRLPKPRCARSGTSTHG